MKELRFDLYDLVARIAPAFLCVLPPAVTVAAISPILWSAINAMVGIAVTLGALIPISILSRSLGKKIESRIWKEWGGKPTTKFLRHRDGTVNALTKNRYHKIATQLIRQPLPTVEEEQANPEAADAVYDSVGDRLKALTRDEKMWHLLAKENRNYGFIRNSLGLRPIGILSALISGGWLSYVLLSNIVWSLDKVLDSIMPSHAVAYVVVLVSFGFWTLIVRLESVSATANEYASRLIEALDILSPSHH